MFWDLLSNFFGRKEVKYFLIICLVSYISFLGLSVISDVNYHKKIKKDKKNKDKLESQKQKQVSQSEI